MLMARNQPGIIQQEIDEDVGDNNDVGISSDEPSHIVDVPFQTLQEISLWGLSPRTR